ncbi:flap endonuclease GEN homolog 1 [Conger conger]|uniref:flap endonuclease GEN homolog 1 n=1 Tax=Conger conger TaxID=82655 RepID=UPI002A5A246D|nr:flap endonuclease GEN homolog 1 [Conger conger]XP_061097700.1 flap endonuclease GEN homolog 1 [Conger conger]
MGVHELWSILEPVRESVPLYHLTGKTLAVDLSLWVCEAQFVKEMMGRVVKPHLRNLFFRVSALTQMGIKLIFVMEGEAPKMKAETMCKRSQLRCGPSKKAAPKTTKTGRSHFKAVLKECAGMLDCLGIPWVTAAGEAEAMCAYLDSLGLVDGCITNDGDSFLYGAQTVYKNFNMTTKDPQVDCYRMAEIQSELHLTRETLVAFAILLGCDYLPKGVPGVGKEQTLKLIKTLQGQTLLQKFTQWQSEGQDMQNPTVKKVTHCLVCHHPGSAKTHERSGCALCGSQHFCQPRDYDYSCPCAWHQTEQARQASSAEASIKRKTLASEWFPFKEIIDEFLVNKNRRIQNVATRKPNLLLMQNFALDKMEWPKSYTSEKVLVLMTYTEMMNRKCGRGNTTQIQPIRIFKPRVRSGIACFEVIWEKPDHYVYGDDHPEECLDTVRTVEEEALFQTAYPDLVDRFLKEREEAKENKLKPKKWNKTKDKESNIGPDDVSDLLSRMTIHSSSTDKAGTSGSDTIATADRKNAQELPRCPESSDQQRKGSKDHDDMAAPQGIFMKVVEPSPSPVSSEKVSANALSPSVSAVIEAMHLSDIDWDGMSFSSSPSPQVNTERPLPPTDIDLLTPVKGLSGTAEKKCTSSDTGESAGLEVSVLNTARAPESPAAVKLSKIPLRERVLARNAIKSSGNHTDIATAQTYPSTNPPDCTVFRPVLPSAPSKDRGVVTHLGQQQFHLKKTLTSDSKNRARVKHSENPVIKMAKKQNEKGSVGTKPLSQHKFVKASRDHAALPQRSHSDSSVGTGHKSRAQAVKKSVCVSVCSSSENSDAENRPVREQRRTVKSKARKRCPYLFDYSLKSTKVMGLHATVGAGSNTVDHEPQALCSDHGKSGCAPTIERKLEAADDGDIFIENSAWSEVSMAKGEDSVISIDSPLPLAERLKLKFK